jgi:tyrosine-protein phosphatase YwqE
MMLYFDEIRFHVSSNFDDGSSFHKKCVVLVAHQGRAIRKNVTTADFLSPRLTKDPQHIITLFT